MRALIGIVSVAVALMCSTAGAQSEPTICCDGSIIFAGSCPFGPSPCPDDPRECVDLTVPDPCSSTTTTIVSSATTTTVAPGEPISGKKLLLKNPPAGTTANKVVLLAKDPAITIGAAGTDGDPQCSGAGGGGTSSLRLTASGDAGDVTISLPCAGWTTNGANSLYKYKDATGATCKNVLVKAGVLVKAVCKGAQVGIDLNASMAPVAVVMRLNSRAYCSAFGGAVGVKDGSDDKTFLHKEAPAPLECP